MHVVAWLAADAPQPLTRQPLSEASRIVYGIIGEMAGTISAEHGIGTLKKNPICHSAAAPSEIDLMRCVKAALDPANILNPTKVFD